jgi:membrane protein
MSKLNHFLHFFTKKFWEEKSEKKPKNIFYSFLAIVVGSIEDFMEDKCFDKASTLTFYSLLSIVPLMAIGFGIAQELGFREKFAEQIRTQLQSQPQVAEKIIEFSGSALKQARVGIIAGFGIIFLFWTVLRMIGNIESFFNEIWKIKSPRTLWQQMKGYLPIIILFPFFLVGASSFIIYVSTMAILAFESIRLTSFSSSTVLFLFELSPYLLIGAILSFLYIYLPNTKVSWKGGIIAGGVAGTLYQFWQWIYVHFQVHAASYGAIYGSFAAIPLFLIWLNYSWLIVLFGAELAYHIQKNQKSAQKNPKIDKILISKKV